MSTGIDSTSDSPRGQPSGAAVGPINTPTRQNATTATHTQRTHNQRHGTSRHKPSASGHQYYGPLDHQSHGGTPGTDQDSALTAAGDDSQDSAQPHSSIRQRKRRSKNPNTHHRKDLQHPHIPAVDGTMNPSSQPSSQLPNSQTPHATPIKQAYAGPTFHASPAASSLPIPKFLSRSVPSALAPSALQAKLDDDVEQSDSSAFNVDEEGAGLSGQRPKLVREESPLDLLFNAHRAEQARQSSSDGLASLGMRSQQSLTPASAERLHNTGSSRPGSSRYRHTHRPSSGTPSDKAMFMMELDGTGESEVSEDGLPPSMPFKDRLGAARSTSSLSQTHSSRDIEEEQRMAKSQALKRMLMRQGSAGQQHSQPGGADQLGSNASPFHRPTPSAGPQDPSTSISPTAPIAEVSSQSPTPSRSQADVKAMENDLRRILKLDP